MADKIKLEIKLHKMSAVCPNKDKDSSDTIKRSKAITTNERARGMQILAEAQTYYSAMQRFRMDRDRCKRYTYGDQWGDLVEVDGKKMTEEEYIKQQGNIPLKTNLIRRLVTTVVGLYRGQSIEPTCIARDRDEQESAEVMSTVLQCNMQLNRMNKINARSMEEFLISGLIAHRKWYGWRSGRMDEWTDYVQSNNIIIDHNMRDFRGWDCSFIGEIHDLDFNELCTQFVHTTEDYARLSEIYKSARDHGHMKTTWKDFGYADYNFQFDFLCPVDDSRCRVIEIWRKESKPRYRCHDYNNGDIFKCDVEDYPIMVLAENNKRLEQGLSCGMNVEDIPFIKAEWFIDSYWYYYYLTPMGDILEEGETPYEHKEHPYVFSAYPFIDGEIHSFVSDIIDTQRYVNRLIIMDDWIRRAGAKGVLMVPEDCLGDTSPEEFADTWVKFNGVLVYKPSKSGKEPHQVVSNSTNVSSRDMLSMQLRFFEEISGVNGALQGKPGYSGMSDALYNRQAQNAATSLSDIIETYSEFCQDAAYKDVKNIQQFYDQKQVINIAGQSGSKVIYDPQKIRDVEFDMSIVQSQATPVHRALANELLLELFKSNAISLEQMLENGSYPFADKLLQNIKSQREQMENGEVPEGISPELAQQVHQEANPEAIAMMQQGLNQ